MRTSTRECGISLTAEARAACPTGCLNRCPCLSACPDRSPRSAADSGCAIPGGRLGAVWCLPKMAQAASQHHARGWCVMV